MSTMNKIACRTYAVLCFFYGVFCMGLGAMGFHWAINGVPPAVAQKMATTISISMPAMLQFLFWLSAGFLVVGIIFIILGVLAWLRYVSVMVIGCVFWMLFSGRSMINAGASDIDGFAVINGIAFVSLTIIAAIAAWRSRSAPQQALSFSA
jgi:hypothetical protein